MMNLCVPQEYGGYFIAVGPSTLYRQRLGESNLMVKALFSLAKKLQPCIIFIDEVSSVTTVAQRLCPSIAQRLFFLTVCTNACVAMSSC
jgi:ATP-dependent 26S proteasome regulatory subunit